VSDEVDGDNSVPVRTTKFCPECGAAIKIKAETCPQCGKDQQVVQTSQSQLQPTSKNPIIAAILNLIIAGLGHVYIGRAKRGIILFLLTMLVAAISSGLGWILGVIVCSYDVYQLAQNKPAPLDFIDEYIEKYWA
jgi:TM2 domain-containing membrane protein YozV/ribosomal protein S27AE